MNKYKDALDNLVHYLVPFHITATKENAKMINDCLNIFKELVDKETPMKVRRGNGMILCCKCNKSLYYCYGDNYCSNCGQKIDFNKDGEENDN